MDGVAALHEDEKMKATQPFGNSLMHFQDYAVVEKVIVRIKERLRTVPKLDILSQPFRISFVKIGNYRFETADIDRLLMCASLSHLCLCLCLRQSGCGSHLLLRSEIGGRFPGPAAGERSPRLTSIARP